MVSTELRYPYPSVSNLTQFSFKYIFHIPSYFTQVAEVFTGHAGKLVTMEQTIAGFKEILSGKYDHLPEVAFYMVGHIDEVVEKADRLAKETGEA